MSSNHKFLQAQFLPDVLHVSVLLILSCFSIYLVILSNIYFTSFLLYLPAVAEGILIKDLLALAAIE